MRSPCLEPISTKDLPAARRATWSMTANDARTGGMSWVPFGPSSSAHEMLARISMRLFLVYILTGKKFASPRRVHRSSKTPLTGEPGARSQNTSNATVHASRSVWRALTVNPGALASTEQKRARWVQCTVSYRAAAFTVNIHRNRFVIFIFSSPGLTEYTLTGLSRPRTGRSYHL